MRFVAALEEGLDPVVTTLDCLPAYLEADLAPPDMLDLMAGWLGLEPDETLALDRRRELVRRAAELGRRRGTRAGLELALQVVFPDLPLRVEDGGGVVVAASVDALPEPAAARIRGLLRPCHPRRDPGCDRAPDRAAPTGQRRLPPAREGAQAPRRRGRVVRICPRCQRENPDDADFCTCGEYLRWDPTGQVPAVPLPPPVQQPPAAPVSAGPAGRRRGLPARRRPPAAPRSRCATRPTRPRPAPRSRSPSSPASAVAVMALVRNQSGIVDNYDLRVDRPARGLVDDPAGDRLPGAVRRARAARTSRRSRCACTRPAAPRRSPATGPSRSWPRRAPAAARPCRPRPR